MDTTCHVLVLSAYYVQYMGYQASIQHMTYQQQQQIGAHNTNPVFHVTKLYIIRINTCSHAETDHVKSN